MKLTLTNIKKMKTNSTPLQKRVINYIVDEWSNYDDKKHIFTDVLYHGCQSGVVGFLIWYSDTVRFYKQYKEKYNLEVMAVNTESDTLHWHKFIADKDLQWVNVNGLVANFDWREYFDVVKTPVVFILDDKNKIIAKNIQGDNIAKIMELLDEGKLKF